MNHEFTAEEVRNAAMAARVYCPGFTENMFESLMELEKHIADSSYLEVIQGILRLEEEKGVACTEALDACGKLMEQKTKLERQVPDLEERIENLVEQRMRASAEYEQLKKTTATAQQELSQLREGCEAAKKDLANLNKKLEKERQRTEKEIERCRQEADVTRAEVAVADQAKKEAEGHGFNLEFMLSLAKEFAGYEDASKELSEGLKKHGSLTQYLKEIEDWCDKEKVRVTGEIDSLESKKKGLTDENTRLTNIISQLQADIKGEEMLRRFYYRYVAVSGLIEELASWNEIFFVRCNNPAFKITGFFDAKCDNARFWTDKPPSMCPQCGYRDLVYDESVYRAIGWQVGTSGKLVLGEYHAQE